MNSTLNNIFLIVWIVVGVLAVLALLLYIMGARRRV
jgi:hypothetical protein